MPRCCIRQGWVVGVDYSATAHFLTSVGWFLHYLCGVAIFLLVMKQNTSHTVQRLAREIIEYDDTREGFAAEHHLVLAAASGLAVSALLAPTRNAAALRGIAAGLLLMRALSGSQGVRAWLQVRDRRPSAPLSPEEARETWIL